MKSTANELSIIKLIGSLVTISIYNLLSAQQTIYIQKNDCADNSVSEKYSVLKNDKSIKHGLYYAFFCQGKSDKELILNDSNEFKGLIKKYGNYVAGKKEGYWITNLKPDRLKEEGVYKNDKKIGIWKFGKKIENDYLLIERYDFDTKEVLSPEFMIWLKYPNEAIENEIQGTVEISFEVQEDCSASNFKILKSVGGGCDEMVTKTYKRYFELKKEYKCTCEAKLMQEKCSFVLD
ncbi:MAG: energy transducer TonB [Chitinophagales bacterium]|nr:energy transducer TonB [Chitinophagales bacterium]